MQPACEQCCAVTDDLATRNGRLLCNICDPACRPITTHDLTSLDDGEAYDLTQTSDNIHDGDVLILSMGRTAVLMKAWPVMVIGASRALHSLADGVTWETLEGGRYLASAQAARNAAEAAR